MPDYYVELKAELEGDLTEIEPFWGWENIDQELMCISPVCSRCHCSFHYLVVSLSKYESPERFECCEEKAYVHVEDSFSPTLKSGEPSRILKLRMSDSLFLDPFCDDKPVEFMFEWVGTTADGHFTDALQLQLGRQQSLYRFGVEVGKARVTASFVDA
ncbi:hypothetical protein HS088_TW19G00056 [Tripterygium wilfordii]|uniref:Uncharacterized protein n=1 Tax=Tripterygium wilfordii TaxID=458696 RepID=A0A7J7C9C5_TRIWF|nr:hypothetical protein HS088_TW19G00056 [Tripterygium wilfordii]